MGADVMVLGGVPLPAGVSWVNRGVSSKVRQTVKETLGGRTVITAQQLLNGEEIELTSLDGMGWYTESERDALKAMADAAGSTYTFTYQRGGTGPVESYTVAFSHHRRGALSLAPVFDFQSYYVGSIFLITQ